MKKSKTDHDDKEELDNDCIQVQQVLEHGEFVTNSLPEANKIISEAKVQGHDFDWNRSDQDEFTVTKV